MFSKCHKCKWENGRLITFPLYKSLLKNILHLKQNAKLNKLLENYNNLFSKKDMEVREYWRWICFRPENTTRQHNICSVMAIDIFFKMWYIFMEIFKYINISTKEGARIQNPLSKEDTLAQRKHFMLF